MSKVSILESIVSAKWLNENLSASNLVILDASIPKATSSTDISSAIQIPQTRFFDIKNKFSDTSAPFPNTMPSEGQFSEEAQTLGINTDSAIVVYDDKGIYSSARVWYMFKAMGHDNVAILNGGLPEWQKSGYVTEPKFDYKGDKGNFVAACQRGMFKNFDDLTKAIQNKDTMILDARSKDRFNGLVVEPRKGLRSGNISGSMNLPYSELLQEGCIKSENELKVLFNTKIQDQENIIFSCGSGITACVLALGAEISGFRNVSVYDGSWTEWGSLTKA